MDRKHLISSVYLINLSSNDCISLNKLVKEDNSLLCKKVVSYIVAYIILYLIHLPLCLLYYKSSYNSL